MTLKLKVSEQVVGRTAKLFWGSVNSRETELLPALSKRKLSIFMGALTRHHRDIIITSRAKRNWLRAEHAQIMMKHSIILPWRKCNLKPI